jgi:hypothetical protein
VSENSVSTMPGAISVMRIGSPFSSRREGLGDGPDGVLGGV